MSIHRYPYMSEYTPTLSLECGYTVYSIYMHCAHTVRAVVRTNSNIHDRNNRGNRGMWHVWCKKEYFHTMTHFEILYVSVIDEGEVKV